MNRTAALQAAFGLAWRAGHARLLVDVACVLAGAAIPVVAAWLTKAVLDQLAGRGGLPWGQAVALAGAGLVGALLPHLTTYLRAEQQRAVGLLASDRLYRAVDRLAGLARFEDPRFHDRLRLAVQAARTTPNRLVTSALGLGRGVLTALGFAGSLLVLNPLLTLVVFVAAVPVLVGELTLGTRRAGLMWTVSPAERREMFYSRLLTGLDAAKEIRLYGLGDFLRGRMLAERQTSDAAHRRLDRRSFGVRAALALLGSAVAGASLVWAVSAAAAGRLTIGDIAMLVAAVAGVQGALVSIVNELAATHQGLLLFDHYLAVARASSDLPTPLRPRPVPPLRRGIELRDVWFRYDDEHPWVLRGVDLFIPHGHAVALVGRNGCGKSTLVKLLCRYYDPTRGSIWWDGVDLREVPVAQLRQRIGAVFQDYMCYDLTAAENIAVGDLAALGDPERIAESAGHAGIHQTLAGLPRGYDTLLSRLYLSAADRDDTATGVVLSGGQWQRLALARGLLRTRPDLMILDEPSSGLDAEAEHEIHSRLRAHRLGRTSLLISHRLGTVRDADLIAVLADGEVVERGSHGELMAAGGEYARLFTLQASGYEQEMAA